MGGKSSVGLDSWFYHPRASLSVFLGHLTPDSQNVWLFMSHEFSFKPFVFKNCLSNSLNWIQGIHFEKTGNLFTCFCVYINNQGLLILTILLRDLWIKFHCSSLEICNSLWKCSFVHFLIFILALNSAVSLFSIRLISVNIVSCWMLKFKRGLPNQESWWWFCARHIGPLSFYFGKPLCELFLMPAVCTCSLVFLRFYRRLFAAL